MLYRTKIDNFKHIDINNIDIKAVDEAALKFIKQLNSISKEELLYTQRKKGFYGKAYNFVVYVNRSPQRIQAFKVKHRELYKSTSFLYLLLTGSGVRQILAYAMFKRLILPKDGATRVITL